MIFGASGGMLGAAHYVTSLKADPVRRDLPRLPADRKDLVQHLNWNFLAESVRYLAFKDFFSLVSPFTQNTDRGKRIERDWTDRMPSLGVSFGSLRAGEESGRLPTLVFSPMIVEDSVGSSSATAT